MKLQYMYIVNLVLFAGLTACDLWARDSRLAMAHACVVLAYISTLLESNK